MCARYELVTVEFHTLQRFFGSRLRKSLAVQTNFDVRPGDQVPIVRAAESAVELVPVHWGLIPFWVHDPAEFRTPTHNVRSDRAHVAPAFREAFRRQRCLIPCTGWFSKRLAPRGQPFADKRWRFGRMDQQDFALAGLWDRWHDSGREIESCTIIICSSAPELNHIAPNMPVILHPESYDKRLDPNIPDPAELRQLLSPYQPVSDLSAEIRSL